MESVKKRVAIDLANRGFTPRVDTVQGDSDSARALELSLTENGKPYPLGSGVECNVRYARADGSGGAYGPITLSPGPAALVPLPADLSLYPGSAMLSLLLSQGQTDLGIFPIDVQVAPDPSAPSKTPSGSTVKIAHGILKAAVRGPELVKIDIDYDFVFSKAPAVFVEPFFNAIVVDGPTESMAFDFRAIPVNVTRANFELWLKCPHHNLPVGVSWAAIGI